MGSSHPIEQDAGTPTPSGYGVLLDHTQKPPRNRSGGNPLQRGLSRHLVTGDKGILAHPVNREEVVWQRHMTPRSSMPDVADGGLIDPIHTADVLGGGTDREELSDNHYVAIGQFV